jgi:hypothetical protein
MLRIFCFFFILRYLGGVLRCRKVTRVMWGRVIHFQNSWSWSHTRVKWSEVDRLWWRSFRRTVYCVHCFIVLNLYRFNLVLLWNYEDAINVSVLLIGRSVYVIVFYFNNSTSGVVLLFWVNQVGVLQPVSWLIIYGIK